MSLTAVIDGFFPSPAGGCVTSAPRNITGCWKTAELNKEEKTNGEEIDHFFLAPPSTHFGPFFLTLPGQDPIFSSVSRMVPCMTRADGQQSSYRWCGTRMLFMPPSLTLIFRQRLDRVWGEVFTTFFTCTHCVAIPKSVSPTRFTSAMSRERTD